MLGRLRDTLLTAGNGAYLPGQTNLTKDHKILWQDLIAQARDNGEQQRKVATRLSNTDTTNHIGKNVLITHL